MVFQSDFINLFIIIFIVINVQIGKAYKHGNKTSMIRSIPCPTILNDIFFNEIGTCKKNGNLMFTQVSMQHTFTCATSILGEKKWDLICHIRMLLASYHPCTFESSIPWVTWVWRINVAFSMFVFTMHSTTLFLMNLCFFISIVCM